MPIPPPINVLPWAHGPRWPNWSGGRRWEEERGRCLDRLRRALGEVCRWHFGLRVRQRGYAARPIRGDSDVDIARGLPGEMTVFRLTGELVDRLGQGGGRRVVAGVSFRRQDSRKECGGPFRTRSPGRGGTGRSGRVPGGGCHRSLRQRAAKPPRAGWRRGRVYLARAYNLIEELAKRVAQRSKTTWARPIAGTFS